MLADPRSLGPWLVGMDAGPLIWMMSLGLSLHLQTPRLFKMSAQISKRRKFVADGVFRAELNEFFTRELAEEGYSGCDVRVTHARTEVLVSLISSLPCPHFLVRSSSAPPTPKKFLARKLAAFAS